MLNTRYGPLQSAAQQWCQSLYRFEMRTRRNKIEAPAELRQSCFIRCISWCSNALMHISQLCFLSTHLYPALLLQPLLKQSKQEAGTCWPMHTRRLMKTRQQHSAGQPDMKWAASLSLEAACQLPFSFDLIARLTTLWTNAKRHRSWSIPSPALLIMNFLEEYSTMNMNSCTSQSTPRPY